MMPVSAPYQATQDRLERTPIYKAKFDSWPIPYSTQAIRRYEDVVEETEIVADTFVIDEFKNYVVEDDFPFINKSVVGDLFNFLSGTTVGTSKNYASLFEGQQSQVFPEQGHSSVGSVVFVLTDLDGDVTNMVMSGVLGERVELYAGFDDIDEDDYLLFFTGIVGGIRSADTLAGYEFTIYSSQSLLNRQVFNVSTSALVTAINASELALTYDVTRGNIGDQFGTAYGSYVQIDDEIIKRGTFNPTTGLTSLLERGALGTVAAEHEAEAEVRELLRIGPAHPMEILLQLYYGTDKAGAGLAYEYIDWAGISAAIPLIGASYKMEFRITEPENAMQWAEKEIFQPLGAYPVTKSNGQNSIVVFRAPSSADSVATIDHDSIVAEDGRPLLTWSLGRDGSLGQIINDVMFLFDYSPATGSFVSSAQFTRPASIDRFGRYPLVIESKGLRSEIANTLTLIAARALQLLNRYENGAPLVQLTTFLQKELIEPGEIISLTSALLPNRFTKTRGVTEALLEVVNRNVRFATGQVDFDLLWTSFQELARDDFNRANVIWSDEPNLNETWDSMAQDTEGVSIISNELYLGRLGTKIIPAGEGHGIALRTQIIGANQSSQLTFKSVSGSGGFAGPVVRGGYVWTNFPADHLVSITGYAAMYDILPNSSPVIPPAIRLMFYDDTDPLVDDGVELATYPVVLVSGDTVRIDVRGSQLRVFLNDVLVIGPIYHATLTTGQPGGLSNYPGTAGGILYDDWIGGDSGWA